MNRLGILTLLLFLSCQVYAQTAFIDSLNQELTNPNLPDSSKIDVFNELAYEWAKSSPKKGLTYADSAITLSKKIGDMPRMSSGLNSKGINFWYLGEDSQALEAFASVLEFHKNNQNEAGEARVLNNMALLLYNQGEYQKALIYHDRANQIFESLALRRNLINSLSNTGVVYLALADYPKALEQFLKALSQTDSSEYNENANLNTNIGLVYKNLGDLKTAEKHQKEAVVWYERGGHKQGLASEYGNLANNYQAQGKYKDAEDLFFKALAINKEIGNQRRIASDLANLGKLYMSLGQLEKAELYLNEAVGILFENQDVLYLSTIYLDKAELFQMQKKPKLSILDLRKKALELAEKSGSLSHQNSAWKALSESYEELGKNKEALLAFQKHIIFRDSIFNNENQKKLTRMQVEFEFEKNAQQMKSEFLFENQTLKAKNEKQRILTGAALLIFVLFIVTGAILQHFYRKKVKADKLRLSADFKVQKAQLEYKALKAQMNPHFIFNALSSISNFLLKNEPEKADYYLNRFAVLIRKILEFSDQELITLEEEIEMLQAYTEIESLRLGKPIKMVIACEPDISMDNVKIPPLLIQPMIENAIWHGIAHSKEEGRIEIILKKEGQHLQLTVRDNGDEALIHDQIENVKKLKKKSMGLGLIQRRLKILWKDQHAQQFPLEWKKLNHGSEIALQLPIIYQ
jgi:tetratricopeptide (TPR) repeat protein